MRRVCRFLSRYRLFFLLLLANVIILFISPAAGKEIALRSFDSFREMLSVIPPIFLLLGLMDVWIPKETMMKYMGKDAGIKGGIFAFVLGSFSAGPLYASFPIAAVFLKKGVSLTNVFLFVGAWATTKIPMMLFEATQLGAKFTITRFCSNLIGMIILAVIMEKTTSQKEAEVISTNAAEQLEENKKK